MPPDKAAEDPVSTDDPPQPAAPRSPAAPAASPPAGASLSTVIPAIPLALTHRSTPLCPAPINDHRDHDRPFFTDAQERTRAIGGELVADSGVSLSATPSHRKPRRVLGRQGAEIHARWWAARSACTEPSSPRYADRPGRSFRDASPRKRRISNSQARRRVGQSLCLTTMKPVTMVVDFGTARSDGTSQAVPLSDGPVVLFFNLAAMTPWLHQEARHLRDFQPKNSPRSGQPGRHQHRSRSSRPNSPRCGVSTTLRCWTPKARSPPTPGSLRPAGR